jgi:hypothetical protein
MSSPYGTYAGILAAAFPLANVCMNRAVRSTEKIVDFAPRMPTLVTNVGAALGSIAPGNADFERAARSLMRPIERPTNETLVVNSGKIGSSIDGDGQQLATIYQCAVSGLLTCGSGYGLRLAEHFRSPVRSTESACRMIGTPYSSYPARQKLLFVLLLAIVL